MRIPKFRLTIGLLMIAIAIAALLLVTPRIPGAIAHRRNVRKKAEARCVATAQSYEATETLYTLARAELREVYLQSRMLLEAQRDVGDSAAAANHLKRMQNVRAMTHSRLNCFGGPYLKNVSDLFVKEAELWVAKEEW